MTIVEYSFQTNKNVFMCKKIEDKKSVYLRSKVSKPFSYFVPRFFVSSPGFLGFALKSPVAIKYVYDNNEK